MYRRLVLPLAIGLLVILILSGLFFYLVFLRPEPPVQVDMLSQSKWAGSISYGYLLVQTGENQPCYTTALRGLDYTKDAEYSHYGNFGDEPDLFRTINRYINLNIPPGAGVFTRTLLFIYDDALGILKVYEGYVITNPGAVVGASSNGYAMRDYVGEFKVGKLIGKVKSVSFTVMDLAGNPFGNPTIFSCY